MKSNTQKEFKDFIDALTGKKEVDTIKTIFSNDGRVHYKNESHKKDHDEAVDEYDSSEDFAEAYEDDFDDEDDAMDYYDDEKDENY